MYAIAGGLQRGPGRVLDAWMGTMEPVADTVYLYRLPVDTITPPAEHYARLAFEALTRMNPPPPASGQVVLKPNVTIPAAPDSRIVTHPGFIVGMVQYLLAAGVAKERIVVAEVVNGQSWQDWARETGYEAALAALDMRITPLTARQGEGVQAEVPDGVVFQHLELFRETVDCSWFLNVPVAKCHNLSCTTLNMKNLQGTVVSPQRHMCSVQAEDKAFVEQLPRITDSGLSLHEERFCHKHADMLTARRHLGMPRLAVIDGMVGRDGTAFREGENHPLGWTVLGQNEVHVDAVGTYLFGLDPERTPYLRVAAQRGLGSNRIADIPVVDLATGLPLAGPALAAHRSSPPLMPLSRYEGGYYARFRADGSVVPWALDRVNEQRRKDGLEPILP